MKVELTNGEAYYGVGSGHPDADADAVVFIHGAGFDHSVWVMPARYFARHGMRVIAPDLPAHGRSAGPACTSIEGMADWVMELIDKVVPNGVNTTVVGHSMGSLVALALADRHPRQTDAVVLIGTSAPGHRCSRPRETTIMRPTTWQIPGVIQRRDAWVQLPILA